MNNKAEATGMKEEKRELTPKLRFPEFRGAAGWNVTILDELSEVVRGGSPRPIDGFLTTAADGLNWLKIGDVDKDAKYVIRTTEKVRREALSKTRVVNHGDLILSNSMSFGRPYILQIQTCIHDGWIAITNIDKQTDRDFLYYLISSPSSQSYFVDNAAGSGVQNLNADIIKALPVCFPSPAEQQKIADCLGTLDELIEAQSRKLDALKAHKKGLMQNLFPREGEATPRFRFPEFQDAPEWEMKALGELLLSKPDYGINAPAVPYSDLLPTYLRITDISDDGISLRNGRVSVDVEPVADIFLEDGDIVFARTGASVGKSYKYRPRDGRLVFAGFLIRVRPDLRKLNSSFFYQYLSTRRYWDWVAITSPRSGQPGINGDEYASLPVPLPSCSAGSKSMEEQNRIADALSFVDELIVFQMEKLEALKTHKKGLMQQLFPRETESEKLEIRSEKL